MSSKDNPKAALNKIINKSRVHLYKPIQIAEILYHHRTETGWNLEDIESYRNISKKWRDNISILLVGRRSTSSQKFQDNLFEANAMPPILLSKLGEMNKSKGGFVEAYIYKALKRRLANVYEVQEYISNATLDTFDVKKLVELFRRSTGLRRSIDKMYEILVYALFSTIVRALKATITLEIGNKDKSILSDFKDFIQMVLGIDMKSTKVSVPASLFRVGVTNAADRGLDMWANFGPAIQVKHLTLTQDLAEDIIESITADKIVIVCLNCEQSTIASLLKQVGLADRIQGIITIEDLDKWYKICLSKKYRKNLASNLLKDLGREFASEFPSSIEIEPFMDERKYIFMKMPKEWTDSSYYG